MLKEFGIKFQVLIFPNYVKSLNFEGNEKHCVFFTAIFLYFFFMIKFNRFELIRRKIILLIAFTLLLIHILSMFFIEGWILLIISLGGALLVLFLAIRTEKMRFIEYPAGFYLLLMCCFVYTIHMQKSAALITIAIAFAVYLFVIRYFSPTIHYVFLRAVLATTMFAMFIKMTFLKDFLSLDGDTYFWIPKNSASQYTSYFLYILNWVHFIILGFSESKIL